MSRHAAVRSNEKGHVEKVKVQRYVSGRKPKFADESSGDDSDDDGFIRPDSIKKLREQRGEINLGDLEPEVETKDESDDLAINQEVDKLDRRLQRLRQIKNSERDIHEPEIIQPGHHESEGVRRRRHRDYDSESDKEDEDDEDNSERRHAALRQRLLHEEEVIKSDSEGERAIDDDDLEDEEEDEESEEEEFSSEDETGPRLKPVFVRKQDRTSMIRQREEEELKIKEQQLEAKKMAEERRKNALKMIEASIKQEQMEKEDNVEITAESIASVQTDDESEEVAYLNWKVRELKRNKRDKEEREEIIRQKEETERLRNMTEEERLEELKRNPKVVVNQASKGKYKFMQKYYHRGAFFLDKDDEVFKRDVAKPTLEDHFDKSVLPKVMQVKNFGMSGRTKYTHLVDQDTTNFESPWSKDSALTTKFYQRQAAGMKQEFERPSKKPRN